MTVVVVLSDLFSSRWSLFYAPSSFHGIVANPCLVMRSTMLYCILLHYAKLCAILGFIILSYIIWYRIMWYFIAHVLLSYPIMQSSTILCFQGSWCYSLLSLAILFSLVLCHTTWLSTMFFGGRLNHAVVLPCYSLWKCCAGYMIRYIGSRPDMTWEFPSIRAVPRCILCFSSRFWTPDIGNPSHPR